MSDSQNNFTEDVAEEDGAVRLQLTLPEEQIVFLQAIIDSYEGLAVVRTLSRNPVVVELQTTPSMLSELHNVLESLKAQVGWSTTGGADILSAPKH